MRRKLLALGMVAGLFCTMGASCLDSAGSLFAGLFTPVVTVVIENDTPFVARPRFAVSDSGDSLQDLVKNDREIAAGTSGTAQPGQTATFTVPCNGSNESIVVRGVAFETTTGFGVGSVDINRRLRHDKDFECGDTIRLRLTGNVFSFNAQVTVEAAPVAQTPLLPQSPTSTPQQDKRDIGDILDELFN